MQVEDPSLCPCQGDYCKVPSVCNSEQASAVELSRPAMCLVGFSAMLSPFPPASTFPSLLGPAASLDPLCTI